MILGNMIPPAILRHALEAMMTDRVELLDGTGATIGESRAQVVAESRLSAGEVGSQTVYTQVVNVTVPADTELPPELAGVLVTDSQQPALIGARIAVLTEALGASGGAVRVIRCQVGSFS